MIDDLSMAHDNLQRELADIKQRLGKDKHELIKSNIALNQEVKVLKKGEALLEKTLLAYKKRVIENEKLSRQNKRYREAIDKIKGELYKMSAWGKEEISMLDIIHDLEDEER